MNIFILSWILDDCAIYHCDKHVIKMILETTQLLSTCWWVMNPIQAQQYLNKGKIYKKTHHNHPSSIWTRECRENYIWLCHLGLSLCKEYAYRYDKKDSDHKCHEKLIFLIHNIPIKLTYNDNKITMPKMAMPDKYKTNNPIYSYRFYYINDKQRMLVWRKREPPKWVPSNLHYIHYESEKSRINKKINKLDKIKTKTIEHKEQIYILKNKLEHILLKLG